MATFYRCDGCRKEISSRDDLRYVQLPHVNNHQNQFTDETDGYKRELCINCVRAILEVLKHIGMSQS